jgi:hypothetical protein
MQFLAPGIHLFPGHFASEWLVPRISTSATICVPAKMLSGWCDIPKNSWAEPKSERQLCRVRGTGR